MVFTLDWSASDINGGDNNLVDGGDNVTVNVATPGGDGEFQVLGTNLAVCLRQTLLA